MISPRFPDIKVKLVGENLDSFFVLAKVLEAMRAANISKADTDTFISEAKSSNEQSIIQVCKSWVNII
jgi:hypothetical protein